MGSLPDAVILLESDSENLADITLRETGRLRHVIVGILTHVKLTNLNRDANLAKGVLHHHVIRAMAVQVEADEQQQRELQPSSFENGKRLDLTHLVEAGQPCSSVVNQHWHVLGGSYRRRPNAELLEITRRTTAVTPMPSKSIANLTSR